MSRVKGRIQIDRARFQQWVVRLWPETLEGKLAASALAHLAVLFFLLNSWWMGAHRLKPAGTKRGSQVMMNYNPGKLTQAPEAKKPLHHIKQPKKPLEVAVNPLEVPQTPIQHGNEAQGDGTFSIAYVQAFPSTKPDLSSVGATADIFIDLQIDDTGHIARVHARKGISSEVDQMVIATVEQWLFHPATKNGKPVSSEQELHFRFERRRNPSGCGWECITLEAD